MTLKSKARKNVPVIKEKGGSGGKKEGREKNFADSRLKVGNVLTCIQILSGCLKDD